MKESTQGEGKADPVPLFPRDELIPAASGDGDNASSSFKAIKECFFFSFFFFFKDHEFEPIISLI